MYISFYYYAFISSLIYRPKNSILCINLFKSFSFGNKNSNTRKIKKNNNVNTILLSILIRSRRE